MADSKPDITGTAHIVTVQDSDLLIPTSNNHAAASDHNAMATTILKIIEQYGLNYERTGTWDGFETFYPIVFGQVSRRESVKMLLPGFPFKSPNSRDKVLGNLPDFGEEFALKHLNGLCENIKTVYEYGAEVHITSDGLVYNDLLGVPDEDVWNFGEAVRQITVDNGLQHLSFLRLWDLLGTPGTWSKEHYLTNASQIRQELQNRYGDPQFEADMANKSTSDMQTTHAKYLEFLKSDLLLDKRYLEKSQEEQAEMIGDTAKAMMGRWKAFAAALETNRTDYVRLSIHDSGGKDKLSMALIPQKQRGALGATPWHSVVVVEQDGSYGSVQRHIVDQEKYELIHHHGRPYFYRAKSELFNWSTDGCDVTFEHLYPTGLVIRPTTGATSVTMVPMMKVRVLANTYSPVVLRGFSETTQQDMFIKGAHDVTDEATSTSGYQYYNCISTPPKGSGYTLFTASGLFFRYLPSPWTVERLESVTCSTLNTGYSKEDQNRLSLIVKHPVTGEFCLRWHEFSSQDDKALVDVINAGIHDQRSSLRFYWERGDLLVCDSIATLHTRNAGELD